jgi:hypothetical protein
MKKARVVDAGGLGFFLFFKGMAAAVSGRSGRVGEAGSSAYDQRPQAVDPSVLAYCAEWVVRPQEGDREFFKRLLQEHGDSLLIAGDAGLFHLHLHTNDPGGAEAEIARYGEILSRKVDSLNPEPESRPELDVALLMDSAVDIPAETEKAEAVGVVPLQILLNDRYFRDRLEIGKEDLYRRMRTERDLVVKTSQPAPLDFKNAFAAALASKRQVLYFSLSSLLSGSFQSALAARRLLPAADQDRIRIMDTLNVSAGSGLLLYRALKLLRQGKDLEQAAAEVEAVRDQVVSLGYVESLEYAVRGGRLPPAAGAITRLLGIRPLVAFAKGKLVKKGALLNARNKERKLVRRFLKRLDLDKSYSLGVVYTDNRQSALRLEDELAKSPLRISAIYQVVGAAVLGAHAGPGTFCLFALADD